MGNSRVEHMPCACTTRAQAYEKFAWKPIFARHAIVTFVSKNKNSKVTREKGKSRHVVLHRFCLGFSMISFLELTT